MSSRNDSMVLCGIPRKTPWYRKLRAFFWSPFSKGYTGPKGGRHIGLTARLEASWTRRCVKSIRGTHQEADVYIVMRRYYLVRTRFELQEYSEDDE